MRCLLLAVTMALACGTQGIYIPQTRANLDVQKVAGPWYPVAMVASDNAPLNTQSAPGRLHIKELRPTAQDGLEITVRRWEDGHCVERRMFAEKTSAPASFQINNQEEGNEAPAADQEEGNKARVPDQEEGNEAPAADQEEGNEAPAADQEEGNEAPAADQEEGNEAPAADQEEGNKAPAADQEEGNKAPAADQEEGNKAPAADQEEGNKAPAADQEEGNKAPAPDQEEGNEAPAADQEEGNKAPAADQEEGNKAPAADQEEGNEAPAAAPAGGEVHVLDTDYKNFLFLCMEAAGAPAKRSLACQYLARTPKADKAVMEKFNRAVRVFSMRASVNFIPTQAEERCRV